MSPSSFTFKLTVPCDPDGILVVAAMTSHAVEYANIEAGAGAAFVERVRHIATEALRSDGGAACLAVFDADAGQLTITIGSHSASQALPA